MRRSPRREIVRHLAIYTGLAPFLLLTLFPLVWMTITAFKHERDLYRMAFPLWFHLPPTLKHFHLLFTQTWFATWLANTVAVSACVVMVTLAVAVPAAYALARLRLPLAHGLGTWMFMGSLVPPILLFVPLAPLVAKLGLMDSRWALVLVYPTITVPFCTWLMIGFFRAIPREIEEAAWIDGCGLGGALARVVLPLSVPGIATIAALAFTLAMQDYLYAVVFASPVEETVITVGLPTMLVRYDVFFWGALMAGGLLVGVPAALAFSAVLGRFVQGLTGVGES
jgi:multiple sugar transport system permease protein